MNQKNVDALDNLIAADVVTHGDALIPTVWGREAVKNGIKALLAAFPNVQFTVERLFAEVDKVVVHVRANGTHTGAWLGAAPTNRDMVWNASAIARFVDGKLVEVWIIQDELGMMQQLGLIPTPGQQ
ncbi:hypothetical protein UH38_12310 [Aliterella atlantica CENA595]|uniref:Ester cyclase n=1 Tax=Aliterella atlantica CENA595 TaxID=1618023 RepID=A0A0D8ZT90_9CYAN|nr:hypothetical protein UH38_12310 [Aliterella atlantica CENA595]